MFEPEINISIKRNMDLLVEKNWLERIARRVLEVEKIVLSTEMGLLITDNKTIQKLNSIYRGEDKPTDVLAFQMTPGMNQEPELSFVSAPDGIKHLGEVVISYPQAVKQAQEQGHSVTRELALLIVHGMLHLLGYDHERREEEQKMRDKENRILSVLEVVLGRWPRPLKNNEPLSSAGLPYKLTTLGFVRHFSAVTAAFISVTVRSRLSV